MSVRFAIIGARRRHQGLGAFIAKILRELGGEVTHIYATSEQSGAEAQQDLRDECGLEVCVVTSLEELKACAVDVWVIASPYAHHEEYIEAALEAGRHLLCEKPIIDPIEGSAERVVSWLAAFEQRGLHFVENVQWPYTLPAFRQLFPQDVESPPSELEFWLSPASSGRTMVVDSLPHVLSMLTTLAEPASHEIVRMAGAESGPRLNLSFAYPACHGDIKVKVHLERCDKPPRPAGYAIDGERVMRRVEPIGYRQFFATDYGEEAHVKDPLHLLLADFLNILEGKEGRSESLIEQDRWIGARMAMLEQLSAIF